MSSKEVIEINEQFFHYLAQAAIPVQGSGRYRIPSSERVGQFAQKLHQKVEQLEESLVFEAEMYTINEYDLKVTEEYLEQLGYSLSLFLRNEQAVTWFEENEGSKTLVIMPRLVKDILAEEVFSKKMPYIFSSATLSENKSFDYIAQSLGIKEYTSFSVDSPFDYDEAMRIFMPVFENGNMKEKMEYTLKSIKEEKGRTLVLFRSKEELQWFKDHAGFSDYPFYFEGESEISDLVKKFQEEKHSVLLSYHLWEGLDIPGESLQNVVIFSLPFPPHDPVFEAKRASASNSFEQVDMPYMLLRLRQGIGRLIRTSHDSGNVHILTEKNLPENVLDKMIAVLPTAP